jgi:hypothetical protein
MGIRVSDQRLDSDVRVGTELDTVCTDHYAVREATSLGDHEPSALGYR